MNESIKQIIKSLGIVFGDIGTSPIYTLTIVFSFIPATPDNIMGVLSLIIWTLTLLVFAQYAWLAMSLSRKGEGGTIVLKELLTPLLTSRTQVIVVTFLTFLGISFLIGDGVITPAISILSAIEGVRLIPYFSTIPQSILLIFACAIALGLFSFQKWGTERVSVAFGPVMVLWFCILSISGLFFIIQAPHVWAALHPKYAFNFFAINKLVGFFTLSKIILCATGGEALYADMGHLGRKPIIQAWFFVFIALVCTYLGQGAFLLLYPSTRQVFYELMLTFLQRGYVPFIILSIGATVIASQAMISGIFSIIYQGITTAMLPRFKIEYTSRTLRSQIYIPFINRMLCILVFIAIIGFRYSAHLANAYGVAASGSMTITAFMISWIFSRKKYYFKTALSLTLLAINLLFLLANTSKIPYGGYWPLLIALVSLSAIYVYTSGKNKLYASLRPVWERSHDSAHHLTYALDRKESLMRRALSTLAGAAAIALVGAAIAPVLTASGATPACTVTYDVTSQWDSGFQASVTVTNHQAPRSGWSLTFAFAGGQRVTQGWNARWSQTGAAVTAVNESWNGPLGTGASVGLGFLGSLPDGPAGPNPAPAAFALNGTTCNVDTEPTAHAPR